MALFQAEHSCTESPNTFHFRRGIYFSFRFIRFGPLPKLPNICACIFCVSTCWKSRLRWASTADTKKIVLPESVYKTEVPNTTPWCSIAEFDISSGLKYWLRVACKGRPKKCKCITSKDKGAPSGSMAQVTNAKEKPLRTADGMPTAHIIAPIT